MKNNAGFSHPLVANPSILLLLLTAAAVAWVSGAPAAQAAEKPPVASSGETKPVDIGAFAASVPAQWRGFTSRNAGAFVMASLALPEGAGVIQLPPVVASWG